MAQMTFLGSGGFFTLDNFHSNVLLELEDGGAAMLIDCGSDIRHSLDAAEKNFTNIDTIYVSHIHADHIGGLEWAGFASYFSPEYKGRPHLVCHESLAEGIWQSLSPSMRVLMEKTNTLSSYFKVKTVSSRFVWNKIYFSLVPSLHIINHDIGHKYNYGLSFKLNNARVFFTGDVALSDVEFDESDWDIESYWNYYEKADIIFHDCDMTNHAKVHPPYDFLAKMPSDIKEKTWLYHCGDEFTQNVKKDGFAGVVKKGQVFKFTS